jgi:hypothetical protein
MKHIAPYRISRFQAQGAPILLTKEEAANHHGPRSLQEIHRLWDEKQVKLAAEAAAKKTP